MPVVLNGIEGIKAHEGQFLGKSEWIEIDQSKINLFADATGDWDWIHVDPEKANQGPFGGTIAHGYLTLALVIPMLRDVYKLENIRMGLNYGINRLRFPAAVPVGSKLRLGVSLGRVEPIENGVQIYLDCVAECDRTPKPAMAAEIVFRFYETPSLSHAASNTSIS
jgi:acyl dehydratase